LTFLSKHRSTQQRMKMKGKEGKGEKMEERPLIKRGKKTKKRKLLPLDRI